MSINNVFIQDSESELKIIYFYRTPISIFFDEALALIHSALFLNERPRWSFISSRRTERFRATSLCWTGRNLQTDKTCGLDSWSALSNQHDGEPSVRGPSSWASAPSWLRNGVWWWVRLLCFSNLLFSSLDMGNKPRATTKPLFWMNDHDGRSSALAGRKGFVQPLSAVKNENYNINQN